LGGPAAGILLGSQPDVVEIEALGAMLKRLGDQKVGLGGPSVDGSVEAIRIDAVGPPIGRSWVRVRRTAARSHRSRHHRACAREDTFDRRVATTNGAKQTEFGDVKRLWRHRLKALAVGVAFIGACSPTRGCIEADFDLAPESRIPRWFVLGDGAKRSDFSVQMDYWGGPVGRTATITLRSRGRTLDSVIATMKDNEPHTLVPKPATGRFPYPRYEILTAKGITEVIEHRRMEPIFYIVDDLQVKRQLGVQ